MARASYETMWEKAPKDTSVVAGYVAVLRLEVQFRATDVAGGLPAAIERMLRLGEELMQSSGGNADRIGAHGSSLVAVAQFELEHGRRDAGRALAQRAADLLTPHLERSKDWRLLDPAVRAHSLLGNREQSALLRSRLQQLGYVPLKPWPSPDLPAEKRER